MFFRECLRRRVSSVAACRELPQSPPNADVLGSQPYWTRRLIGVGARQGFSGGTLENRQLPNLVAIKAATDDTKRRSERF